MADEKDFSITISRRTFLKVTGTVGLVSSFYVIFGTEESLAKKGPPQPVPEPPKLIWSEEVPTICCYCSCGCGALCGVEDGEVVAVVGDPDHPINGGTLCSKGASLLNLRRTYDAYRNLVLNPERLTQVLYRAPGGTDWQTLDWNTALNMIAARVKATRDAYFEETADVGGSPVTVNRTKAIAHWGSAAIDNEENYLMHKLMRSLGVINFDHHARL